MQCIGEILLLMRHKLAHTREHYVDFLQDSGCGMHRDSLFDTLFELEIQMQLNPVK
jgi:hypothetical protein